MEKLQQALDKARAARDGRPHAAPAAPAPDAPPTEPELRDGPDPAEIDAAWAALTPLDVDEAGLHRSRVVTLEPGKDATPFDILRTKTLLQMRRNGWKRLAITSPGPACGKTTTAVNLGLSMARQAELRTLLLEMDLRRPSMAKLIGKRPEVDICEMLSGDRPFREQALRVRDNLAISMVRKPPHDPARYMLSEETEHTLDRLERDYAPDLVVFDLPPLMVSDDARAFLGKVDCALMVIRAEQTTMAQIDSCEREISEHTNVLGMVLSHARFSEVEGGYYGYDYR